MKVEVPDMTCKRCAKKIEEALLEEGLKAKVELTDKSISFEGEHELDRIRDTVAKAGYSIRVCV